MIKPDLILLAVASIIGIYGVIDIWTSLYNSSKLEAHNHTHVNITNTTDKSIVVITITQSSSIKDKKSTTTTHNPKVFSKDKRFTPPAYRSNPILEQNPIQSLIPEDIITYDRPHTDIIRRLILSHPIPPVEQPSFQLPPGIWIPPHVPKRAKRETMEEPLTVANVSGKGAIEVDGTCFFRVTGESDEEFVKRILESPEAKKAKNPKEKHRRSRSQSSTPGKRSKSQESHKGDKKLPEKCRYYEKSGVCSRGANCSYIHDYSKPLTAMELRMQLDSVSGQLYKIRANQSHLGATLDQIRADTTQKLDLIMCELKKLGVTSRDATQVPHMMKKTNIKERASHYKKKGEYKF